jgi:predicted metal-dependent phosphoesterase TrpH
LAESQCGHKTNNRVDLHLHSTASDGVWSPAKLVQVSLELGLLYISLTDHDTTSGIQQALNAAWGTPLVVIPGVEISTEAESPHEIHILGYYVDYHYAPLQRHLETLRRSRTERAQQVIELLAQNGLPLSWQRVTALAGPGSLGRPHIAQAMVEANYVDSVERAFDLYLGKGGPAYVPRAKLRPEEAIQLVLEAGGIPVLAHPSRVVEHIPRLVEAGLMGLEAHYSDYLEAETEYLLSLARKHGLLTTGGTDFHGAGITSAPAPGATYVPMSAVEELIARADRVAQKHVPSP